MKQVATVQSGIPNVYLESQAISRIVEENLRLSLNDGLDSLAVAAFAALLHRRVARPARSEHRLQGVRLERPGLAFEQHRVALAERDRDLHSLSERFGEAQPDVVADPAHLRKGEARRGPRRTDLYAIPGLATRRPAADDHIALALDSEDERLRVPVEVTDARCFGEVVHHQPADSGSSQTAS